MKKILALLLILAMMITLIACTPKDPNEEGDDDPTVDPADVDPTEGGDTDPEAFDYMAEDLTEYLTLGKYEGLEATKEPGVLTDELFENYMNNALAQYSDYVRIYDRPVEEGETVLIDYRGSIDGVDFGGGTAQNQELVASDGQGYIPGFGSGIVGHTPGETFDINVTFPDPYPNNTEFSGKEAVFTIYLHCIVTDEINYVTLDTLTDEFVTDNFDFDSAEQFIQSQREALELEMPYMAQQDMFAQLWQQIIDASEVIKYPEGAVEAKKSEMMEYYEMAAEQYQMSIEELLEYAEIDMEYIETESKAAVKEDLVMYSLIKALDAKVTEEDIAATTAFFCQVYDVSEADIYSIIPKSQMEMTSQFDKVMGVVAEGCNITEVPGTLLAE